MINRISTPLTTLRKNKPLVLCLTNYVTMDFMANSLLALGALPLMSYSEDELEELIAISHAININLGTLDRAFIARCQQATACAKKLGKPIILDPVGAGASALRTAAARSLMNDASIIRGNASEISALIEDDVHTQGVETTRSTDSTIDSAIRLAKQLHNTIVISGKDDCITDGTQTEIISYGSPLMPLVTGMGCTLTAVIAAFHAVQPDTFEAALAATAYFGLCGNYAEEKASAPGSFRMHFIDALHTTPLFENDHAG